MQSGSETREMVSGQEFRDDLMYDRAKSVFDLQIGIILFETILFYEFFELSPGQREFINRGISLGFCNLAQ